MSNFYNIHNRWNRPVLGPTTKNYQFINKLGEGAFSVVYHAFHKRTKQYVALKEIRLNCLDRQYNQLCVNEVELLRRVNSNHVVKCYDAFFEKNFLYVSLEFIDGKDMLFQIQLMQRNGQLFSERSIWYWFHQICCGLKDMHAKKIMHRDIKPANVFLDSRSRVKLGDLGLGRLLTDETKLAKTQVGTEYYMAPERNTDEGYSFKSDIWSLGCMLYELCTLQSPFCGENDNAFALHKKIAECRYLPFPSEVYSKYLTFFVQSCLSLSPNDRPTAEMAHGAAYRMFVAFENLLLQNSKKLAEKQAAPTEAPSTNIGKGVNEEQQQQPMDIVSYANTSESASSSIIVKKPSLKIEQEFPLNAGWLTVVVGTVCVFVMLIARSL